jgi:hypothetical protein
LLRADRIAVGILIAAVVVVAAVVAVRSDCRGAGRRTVSYSAIDASADRGARYRAAGYRTISVAASRDSGNAVTTAPGSASVIASTPVTATTAPTCERIIRHKADADQNDCCQCSEGISKHGLFSCPACGSSNARPAAILTPRTAFSDGRMEA